jgi:hypothetical protein
MGGHSCRIGFALGRKGPAWRPPALGQGRLPDSAQSDCRKPVDAASRRGDQKRSLAVRLPHGGQTPDRLRQNERAVRRGVVWSKRKRPRPKPGRRLGQGKAAKGLGPRRSCGGRPILRLDAAQGKPESLRLCLCWRRPHPPCRPARLLLSFAIGARRPRRSSFRSLFATFDGARSTSFLRMASSRRYSREWHRAALAEQTGIDPCETRPSARSFIVGAGD